MSNCKCAPYTVLRMWSQRRCLQRRSLSLRQVDTDAVEWSSDAIEGLELTKRSLTSPLISKLVAAGHATVVRFMSLVRQAPRDITNNDWVLLKHHDSNVVACVSEMACVVDADGRVRNVLRCTNAATVTREHDDGCIWLPSAALQQEVVAWCDEVAITVLSRHERGEHVQFVYVW
jgi:hypothetical protein